jgi:hypothetical protein
VADLDRKIRAGQDFLLTDLDRINEVVPLNNG